MKYNQETYETIKERILSNMNNIIDPIENREINTQI